MSPAATGRRPERRPAQLRLTGALVVLVVVTGLALAYFKPNPLANTNTVRATFADASGIGVVGADVRMAGTPVGKITDVQREGDHAIVTMELDDSAGRIGSDATAELRPQLTFEGTAFIDLRPGSAGAPALGDRAIPMERTRRYVPLDAALRFARPATREDLREMLDGLGATMDGPAPRGLQRALRAAPGLVADLPVAARAAQGSTRTELLGAIRGFSRTVDALSRTEAELVPLVRGAQRTMAGIAVDRGDPLGRTLSNLPQSLDALERGGHTIRRVIDALEPLAVDLRPAMVQLAPALRELRPLLQDALPVVRRGAPLVADLRGAIREGARSAPALQRLLAALDPSLRLLDSSLVPALERPTAIGSPAYLALLNLFQGGGGASRPFQSAQPGQNDPEVPGSGHYIRFGAKFLSGPGIPIIPCAPVATVNPVLANLMASQNLCQR